MAIRIRIPISVATAAVLAAGLAIAPARAAESASAETARAEARADYERNHWQRAFDTLAGLADAGDADAARWAWLMARHGPALYGTRFEPDPLRGQRWLALASGLAAETPQRLSSASSTELEEQP